MPVISFLPGAIESMSTARTEKETVYRTNHLFLSDSFVSFPASMSIFLISIPARSFEYVFHRRLLHAEPEDGYVPRHKLPEGMEAVPPLPPDEEPPAVPAVNDYACARERRCRKCGVLVRDGDVHLRA